MVGLTDQEVSGPQRRKDGKMEPRRTSYHMGAGSRGSVTQQPQCPLASSLSAETKVESEIEISEMVRTETNPFEIQSWAQGT